MKFLHLFNKSSSAYDGFAKIYGYEDIKDIVRRTLDSDENYNLLFIGPPASSKTLFLQSILEIRKDGVYFDGSNTTSRILDVLEKERSKIICIDELDKMSKPFQNQLLNFMESGRIDVEQQKKQYHFEIKGAKMFATCNEINRLSKPLQSRFRKLFLPRYTEEQFLHEKAEDLINKHVHPTLILDGYYAASEHALKLLQKIAIKVAVEDKELLMKIARTSMYSKLVSEDTPI